MTKTAIIFSSILLPGIFIILISTPLFLAFSAKILINITIKIIIIIKIYLIIIIKVYIIIIIYVFIKCDHKDIANNYNYRKALIRNYLRL